MRENNTMTNPEDRSSHPARVVDLSSYRIAKVRVEPESADFAKHADEAMALNDKPAPAAICAFKCKNPNPTNMTTTGIAARRVERTIFPIGS